VVGSLEGAEEVAALARFEERVRRLPEGRARNLRAEVLEAIRSCHVTF